MKVDYQKFKDLCDLTLNTPADVSRATGISKSNLSHWKRGDFTPKADKLMLIADYFGVDLSYFYGDTDDSEEAKIVGQAYLNAPSDIQKAVRKLLDIKEKKTMDTDTGKAI